MKSFGGGQMPPGGVSGGGGGGYKGTWVPGAYKAGDIVTCGPYLFAALVDTSVQPFMFFGNVGNPTDWQYNSIFTNDATAGTVTLISNTNGSSATAFYKTNKAGWDKLRLAIDASINGSADCFQFGIYDGSLTTTPGAVSLLSLTGVWGVELDMFNAQVAPLINGARDGFHNVAVRVGFVNNTAINAFDRWYLDLVDNGAGLGTMTMTLYRGWNSSPNNGISAGIEAPFDSMGGPTSTTMIKVASWTITRPTFTNWKFCIGARTGGAHGQFSGARAQARDTSGAWTVLASIPDRQ